MQVVENRSGPWTRQKGNAGVTPADTQGRPLCTQPTPRHEGDTGNGSCVLLAQHGGEGEVELPFATDAQIEAHRAHPLHLLVHLGQPGTNFAIGVYGTASDPCIDSGNYVND
jgi:hypothetical protein